MNDIYILGGARTPMGEYTGKLKDFSALELGAIRHIPPGFNEWFAQCVARSPNDRFVTAGAAYRALTQSID